MPFINGVVSVGTTATLICTPSSAPDGDGVLVQNLGAVVVYVGGPGVTAGTTGTGGLQLPVSTTPVLIPTTGASTEALYGITASSTANVSFVFPG